ncbi:MAG: TatD family hydrolase [Clostridia bacterium]|nr:TatD family hydrolase [Clostridia bacterium]
MMIDVHCHLTGEEYESLGGVDEIVARAKRAGVEKLICSGFDLPSSIAAKNLAERHEGVYFCAGFHPSELHKYREGDLEKIKELACHSKCVAVGEIGLDYHFEDNPERSFQQKLFREQIRLASGLGLPIVVHSRDAAADTLTLLEEESAHLKKGGLMHCYSYSKELTPKFLSLGFSFSFGGPATFKNAKKVQEAVESIPVCRILTETDCPYLTPEPKRGTFPNEPCNVAYVLEKLALLKNQDKESLEKSVEENAKNLFFKLK